VRAGNVIMINDAPMVVIKAEYNKSGRNAAVVKMKLQNLLQGTATESIFKADEKFEDLVLDRKEVTFSYESGDMYVWMDTEYNQYEVHKDFMADALNYLKTICRRDRILQRQAAVHRAAHQSCA
jgi:elongation factor P